MIFPPCGRVLAGEMTLTSEMSHPDALDFMQQAAKALAQMAVESGAAGVVAPATRPERLKEIRNIIGDLTIISPGVGVQGGSASDAIRAGADYVIVGRSIYGSEHPEVEAKKIADEIKKCR